MASTPTLLPPLEFHPASADRWADLEALFGPRGACGGCWCMAWRLPRSEFARQKGEGNRQSLAALVSSGEEPGILAYAAGRPVGWCCVAPRERFPVLERSRVLKRIDGEPVWSVVCFFVAREYRRRKLAVELLRAAIAHVRSRGGRIVEGYPVEPKKGRLPDAFAWTGPRSAFNQAGFTEAARGSAARPIMRFHIADG
ncbi:MAG: GNAT family N-acetyltransferase [Acidobacteriota bacterium]